jgi:hypothetical protein
VSERRTSNPQPGAAIADDLRAMHAIARTVNGGTPADAPEREVSKRLSAALDALVQQGVSVYRLAQLLGVRHSAITARLGRHGYRALPPSQADDTYKGRGFYEATEGGAHPQETCDRGHPLYGDNLYVAPKTGARGCRECTRRRGREYYQRKQQCATN